MEILKDLGSVLLFIFIIALIFCYTDDWWWR